MWLFTRYGFLSCVCGTKTLTYDKKGNPLKKGPDFDVMMVRARLREHLEKVLTEYLPAIPLSGIKESKENDYRFRIILDRTHFAELMVAAANDIDYSNFKSEVFRLDGASDYERALHKVWSVMYGVQVAANGPGIYSAPARPLTDEEIEDELAAAEGGADDEEANPGSRAGGKAPQGHDPDDSGALATSDR